jgi:glycosyltransferase involved in cell wall biosynthesis
MPIYNERATVRKAIDQVLDVEFPVAETQVVVVDDGSRDGTADVLADGRWPERVTVVSHESNRGKGAAVRTALAHASGTYAAIMDA